MVVRACGGERAWDGEQHHPSAGEQAPGGDVLEWGPVFDHGNLEIGKGLAGLDHGSVLTGMGAGILNRLPPACRLESAARAPTSGYKRRMP